MIQEPWSQAADEISDGPASHALEQGVEEDTRTPPEIEGPE